MYQKTIELGETILKLYNEGFNCEQICKAVNSSKKTVKKVLLNFGIDYSSVYKSKQEEKRTLAVEMYSKGIPQTTIEKELGIARGTIRELLDNSIGRRSRSKVLLNRWGTILDENSFNDLSNPETAYWIGFLYADGHLQKGQQCIGVTLQEGDKSHLEKLKTFIKSNKEVKKKIQKEGIYYNYDIHSETIYNKFKELGFDNNKSHTAIPPIELINSRDFWRGVVDGDGCLHHHKDGYLQLHLCGTYSTINLFIEFLEKIVVVRKHRVPRNTSNLLHEVSYYKEGINIADLLYKDAVIFLDRKYKLYRDWIQK